MKNLPTSISEEMLDEIIAELIADSRVTYQKLGGTRTLAHVELPNGFSVLGEANSSLPENFDSKEGKTIALANAIKQIQPLLGFLLRDAYAGQDEDRTPVSGYLWNREEGEDDSASPTPPTPPPPLLPPSKADVRYQTFLRALREAPEHEHKGNFAGALAPAGFNGLRRLVPVFRRVQHDKGVPVPILAAISSRESHHGALLDSEGRGDRGNAYGAMQVDKRYHEVLEKHGPFSQHHVGQAADIFLKGFDAVVRKHPQWPLWAQLKGAFVAYNSGVGNVQTIERMDLGTAGNNYGADVLGRALYYQGSELLSYDD